MREQAFALLEQEKRLEASKLKVFSEKIVCNLLDLGEAIEKPPQSFRMLLELKHDNPASMPREWQERFIDGWLEVLDSIMKNPTYYDPKYYPVVDALIACIRSDVLSEWADATG